MHPMYIWVGLWVPRLSDTKRRLNDVQIVVVVAAVVVAVAALASSINKPKSELKVIMNTASN